MRKLAMPLVTLFVVASPAVASPPALFQGHWSLGFEADRDVNVNVGYGLADMTRLILSAGLFSRGDVEETEVTTSYSVGIALHRYLDGASTERFALFWGAGVTYLDPGQTIHEVDVPNIGTVEVHSDPGEVIDLTGRFGVEVFPWEPLSVSGYVGVALDVRTDGVVSLFPEEVGAVEGEVDFGNDVSTFSSALIVTLFWGGS